MDKTKQRKHPHGIYWAGSHHTNVLICGPNQDLLRSFRLPMEWKVAVMILIHSGGLPAHQEDCWFTRITYIPCMCLERQVKPWLLLHKIQPFGIQRHKSDSNLGFLYKQNCDGYINEWKFGKPEAPNKVKQGTFLGSPPLPINTNDTTVFEPQLVFAEDVNILGGGNRVGLAWNLKTAWLDYGVGYTTERKRKTTTNQCLKEPSVKQENGEPTISNIWCTKDLRCFRKRNKNEP